LEGSLLRRRLLRRVRGSDRTGCVKGIAGGEDGGMEEDGIDECGGVGSVCVKGYWVVLSTIPSLGFEGKIGNTTPPSGIVDDSGSPCSRIVIIAKSISAAICRARRSLRCRARIGTSGGRGATKC
jgi:hypothetical protein